MTTFVTVGHMAQPFPRLLAAVRAIAGALPRPIVVQAGHTPFAAAGMEIVEFLAPERFTELVRDADVMITHAGAGALIHALRAGRMPVVMARRAALGEAVDDHQEELAEAFAAQGRVRLACDANSLRDAVDFACKAVQAPAPAPSPLVVLVAEAIRARMRDARR